MEFTSENFKDALQAMREYAGGDGKVVNDIYKNIAANMDFFEDHFALPLPEVMQFGMGVHFGLKLAELNRAGKLTKD